MKIYGIGFDVMETNQTLLCVIEMTPTSYKQWQSSLKICGKYNKGTKLNTVLMVNQCHMGVFCMRFIIGRWGY